MNRREFLMASSCFLATPAVALAAQSYEPGLVKQLLSEGKTVFVDYTTEWCTTCAAQKRTLARLLKDNPAYGERKPKREEEKEEEEEEEEEPDFSRRTWRAIECGWIFSAPSQPLVRTSTSEV